MSENRRGFTGFSPRGGRAVSRAFSILVFFVKQTIIFNMADFEQQETEYIEVPDDRTESEREYDRQIERLDSFFSGIQPGVTLLIERLKPSWCSGLLEEITVNDEVIDLQYFIENWGGQLLSVKVRGKKGQLQGSYKVPLHSYPPLRYGEKIFPYDKGERFKEGEQMQGNQPVIVNPPQSANLEKIFAAIPAILPFVIKWLEATETRRQNDMVLMMQMMKGQNSGGGIADISKLGAVMAQLNEVFRKNMGGDGGGGNEMDFIPQALDVLKMVLAPGGEKKQPEQRARLAPPSMSGPPAASSTPPRSKVTPLPTATPAASPADLANNISALPPDAAAETIIEALGRMDPSKRDAAIGHFLGEYSATMEEDESDFEGDDEQEQDDEKRGVR